MQKENAVAGVFLTKAMPGPKHRRKITKIGGNVWFLPHDHLMDIAPVIRHLLIRKSEIEKLQKSRSGKKDKLYDHVVGDQFRDRVEAVYRNRRDMRDCADKLQKQITRLLACLDNKDVNKMFVEIERITDIQFEERIHVPYQNNKRSSFLASSGQQYLLACCWR